MPLGSSSSFRSPSDTTAFSAWCQRDLEVCLLPQEEKAVGGGGEEKTPDLLPWVGPQGEALRDPPVDPASQREERDSFS